MTANRGPAYPGRKDFDMKLYIYTTTEDCKSTDWDAAIANNEVEVIATIEGNDQTAIESIANERYSDTDTYGYTYSNDIPEAQNVEHITAD